jgi:uncharacterized glyoxalase superfamily protein PhnB
MLESDKKIAPLNPYLIVPNLNQAAAYYMKAFGARQAERYTDQTGKVWYAVFKVFGTPLQLMEPDAQMGLAAKEAGNENDHVAVHITVPSAEAAHARALRAGGTTITKPQAGPTGVPTSELRDPFGFRWIIASGSPTVGRVTPALSPVLVVDDVNKVSAFWKNTFGAVEAPRIERGASPVGPLHPIRLGAATLHLSPVDEARRLIALPAKGHPAGDHSMVTVAVDNVDSAFETAISQGATPIVQPQDAYWGDRYAEFRDVAGLRVSDPAELQQKLNTFLSIHDNPTSPAGAVGVENVNAG